MRETPPQSGEYRCPLQATPMSERDCHQRPPPGAPTTLLRQPRTITRRHATRLTKATLPRCVCELQDFSFAVISASRTIPSIRVMCRKTKRLRCDWKSPGT
ncbi:hypothetical protein LDENG_00135770 [Lucifuga dentata]|nr:hypothetical protein LDENG_00135770 [Lucifuga dentata]